MTARIHEMNDTTQNDELMERVRVLLRGYLGSIGDCDAASGSVTTMLHIEKGAATEIIALVTAARDAEIREALMQPEVVKEAAKEVGALDDRFYDGSAIDAMQCALEAALGYIGLSDDTGGQG